MPFEKKYKTEEERHEAEKRSKREWYKRNRKHVRQQQNEHRQQQKAWRKLRDSFTREDLLERAPEIMKDLETMSQRAVAAKWGRHRRTIMRIIEEFKNRG
jgi:hypothetical protein